MSKKLSLKGSGMSKNQKEASRADKSQNVWDKLEFSSDVAHNGKRLISVSPKFFSSINQTILFVERLGTGLWFYEV